VELGLTRGRLAGQLGELGLRRRARGDRGVAVLLGGDPRGGGLIALLGGALGVAARRVPVALVQRAPELRRLASGVGLGPLVDPRLGRRVGVAQRLLLGLDDALVLALRVCDRALERDQRVLLVIEVGLGGGQGLARGRRARGHLIAHGLLRLHLVLERRALAA